MIRSRLTCLCAAIAMLAAPLRGQATPRSVADELMAADRAFSASGAGQDLVTSLSAMFADDIVMPTPPGRFARGKAEAVTALKANAANLKSRVVWTPVRAGVSADGLHGFTFGAMTIKRDDGANALAKYLAYWVKGPAGWRVAAYKRVGRAEGVVSPDHMDAALPAALVAVEPDSRAVQRHRASLVAAEQAFSDLAQRIGLGPAFKECGSTDAINLGGGASAGFVVGNEAIAKLVQGDAPITDGRVHWSADTALVASSGDLGVTFGFIKPNGAAGASTAGAPAEGGPFFTIWRRSGPGSPWRYVAE